MADELQTPDLEKRVAALEGHIAQMIERNQRVESEKSWETSLFRSGCICVLTYFVALGLTLGLDTHHPYLAPLIPVAMFYVSSRTLPLIKRWWISRKFAKRYLVDKDGV